MSKLILIWTSVLTLILLAQPVSAQAGRYLNSGYGYRIDLPSGFAVPDDAKAEKVKIEGASGAVLQLTASNHALNETTELRKRTARAQSDGWTLIYPVLGPGYLIFAGQKSGKNFYEKAIAACGGTKQVTMRLDYSDAAAPSINAALDRVATSLVSADC